MSRFFNSRFFTPLFILAIGLAFLGFASLQLMRQYQLSQNGVVTQGRVVELVAHSGDNGITYAPVVQFLTKNNRQVTFISGTSSQPPEYRLNDKVTVIYLPDHPDQAEIKGAGTLLLIVFSILGFVMTVVGLIITILTLRSSLGGHE